MYNKTSIVKDNEASFIDIPPINIENETSVLKFIQIKSKEYLSKYCTTIEEDIELLNSIEINQNIRNAVMMRLGEKRILDFFLNLSTYSLTLLEINNTKVSQYLSFIYYHLL